MSDRFRFLPFALCCLFPFIAASDPSTAMEHPVSVIKGKAFIGPNRMTISFEVVYADDLELFHGLEANPETGLYDEDKLDEAIETHGKFLQEKIQVVDADGKLIKSNLINIIDIEIPDEGLPAGSLMEYSLLYTYEYSFEKTPQFLTFQHLIDDVEMPNPVEIDLTLKQAGADPPYPRFGLRFNKPETREFKWTEGATATQAEIDDWLAKELDPEMVGIEGYSSSYSFIYVTDYEVRHELLIPLATLAAGMIDFERADKSFLTIEEQDAATSKIEDLFSEGNPVTIDGIEVQPRIDRIDFYGLDTRDFAIRAPRRKISMINGRVGIILSYSTKGTPDEVVVKWETFTDAMKIIDSVIIAFEDVSRFKFARYKSAEFKEVDENVLVWKNPGHVDRPEPQPITIFVEASQSQTSLKRDFTISGLVACGLFAVAMIVIPRMTQSQKLWRVIFGVFLLVSITATTLVAIPQSFASISQMAGLRPTLPDDEATEVFEGLHKNMFRAFDYHREEDVYDALEASVDGPLLTQLYLDIRKSLAMQTQGGAISHIDEVQYVGGQLSEPIRGKQVEYPGFAFRCRWNLVGSVEHWAHIHQRTNEYDAIFHVDVVDGEWKITAQQIVDESAGPVKQWRRKLTVTDSKKTDGKSAKPKSGKVDL